MQNHIGYFRGKREGMMTSKQRAKDLKLLTAAEIADILRMNHQVILRKLQSGEIEGYKLGKDWRVEEGKFWEWLQSKNNRLLARDERAKTIQTFFKEGKLVSLPAKRKKRLYVLERIWREFSPNRVYSEGEVNEVIRRFYDDFCTIRRELVDNGFMVRSGGKYKAVTGKQNF